MKIYIEDEVLEFYNDVNEIENILNIINEKVQKSYKILNFIRIDDVEIYNDYKDYFVNNIKNIEKVEIFLNTYKELVNNILISILDYTNKTPDIIESLSDRFYKNPDKAAWDNLNNLLEGISFILNTFKSIDEDKRLKDVVKSYEEWNLYAKEIFAIQEILPDFKEALSNEDSITIADILSYEIIPIFNNIKERVLVLLNMEGVLNDTNR